MTWIRYENGFKWIHNAMLLTTAFFMLTFIFAQVLLAACFAAVFAMLAFQNFYFSKVGKDVTVRLKGEQKRFLVGDEDELVFLFENGKIPIWNATLTLSIQDAVAPSEDNTKHFSGIYDFSVPFAIGRNKQVELRIPLQGKRRGLAHITRVMLEIPHLFGDGNVLMELDEPVRFENMVYPNLRPISGGLKSSPFRPGEIEQRQSLYQDAFQPIGTRDYVPTDRFDQIHWTASARMQKLQTKQFLPVSDQNIMLVLNVLEKDHRANDFESRIEVLASYAKYCMDHDIPYAVSINIKTFGATPYIYLPAGKGKVHFQQTMETLARISDKHAKIPFENMLLNLEAKGKLPSTIIMISHGSLKVDAIVQQWSRKYSVTLDSFSEGDENAWEPLQMTGTDSSTVKG